MQQAGVLFLIFLAWAMPSAAQVPCSPANYTHITNTAPLPSDFCAFAYLPWRSNIPANPQHIDQANTTILQQDYAPNSGLGAANAGINVIQTIHTVPQNDQQGNGNHVTYIASASDPLVTADCAQLLYGCSDGHANGITSMPAFRIPPYTRPSNQFGGGDSFMSVIQPNGDVVDTFQCLPSRDWQDGDVISNATCGVEG